MRTNSPIDDPLPFEAPEVKPPKKLPDNDWAKLGKSRKYPQIKAYMEGKKETYRRYMPDGTAIASLTEAEAGRWWKCAATLIAEFELLENKIEAEVRVSKIK